MGRLTPSQIAEAVRKVPLFSALGEAGLEKLLGTCRTENFPAGSQVFSPSQQAECFYVILAGKVKLYKLSGKGNEQILHLYGPGQTFGEAVMWAGVCYPAFAEVLTDAALLVVSRRALKSLIEKNADLALAMLAGMSAKLRQFNELIEQLSLKEVPARLAKILLELPASPGTNTVVLNQTKRQLAAQIGTVAETLSRSFKKLTASGLIKVNGSQITIIDPEGLAEWAES
ncbi:MAG: Crp/Fnr family transcriptional regulator [Planctomycetes bacterium]|nr:Crp/Fnr family transcriptional regulator [Planctomycetota bacterium]